MADKAYDYKHQKLRARLLPKAWGQPCPMCGEIMHKDQPLHLDHSTPVVLGGTHGPKRMVHEWCNTSAGASLGNRLRGRRGSQDW